MQVLARLVMPVPRCADGQEHNCGSRQNGECPPDCLRQKPHGRAPLWHGTLDAPRSPIVSPAPCCPPHPGYTESGSRCRPGFRCSNSPGPHCSDNSSWVVRRRQFLRGVTSGSPDPYPPPRPARVFLFFRRDPGFPREFPSTPPASRLLAGTENGIRASAAPEAPPRAPEP